MWLFQSSVADDPSLTRREMEMLRKKASLKSLPATTSETVDAKTKEKADTIQEQDEFEIIKLKIYNLINKIKPSIEEAQNNIQTRTKITKVLLELKRDHQSLRELQENAKSGKGDWKGIEGGIPKDYLEKREKDISIIDVHLQFVQNSMKSKRGNNIYRPIHQDAQEAELPPIDVSEGERIEKKRNSKMKKSASTPNLQSADVKPELS